MNGAFPIKFIDKCNTNKTQQSIQNLVDFPITKRKLSLCLLYAPYGEGEQAVAPLGLMTIAAYVEAKLGVHVTCHVIDLSGVDPSDFSAIDKISEYLPDLIGISIYSDNVKVCINWAKTLRAKIPNTVIFGGGPHISLVGREFVEAYADYFDVVFQGEGEEPTLALLLATLKTSPEQNR